MEHKQLFNTLPRPTFRWLRCNHLESEIRSMAKNDSTVTVSGDTDILSTIIDNELMKDEFVGANEEALRLVQENFSTGYEIDVPEGQEKSVVFHAMLTKEAPSELLRLRINAAKHAKVSVHVICESEPDVVGAFHMLTEVNAEEASEVTIKKVQLLSEETQHIEHRYAYLADSADVRYLNVELGGQENIYNYDSDFEGKKCLLDHDFAYLGDKKQRFDISMVMSHRGKKSNSDIHVLGALTGNAKKAFRGTLDFLRGCTGAEGAEEDTCLLMNDRVKSISLPLLLCKEDDVVGNHAASAGQMDQNKLFYLMSRGFSEAEAKVMLVESMLRPILDKVGMEEIEHKALLFIRSKIQ